MSDYAVQYAKAMGDEEAFLARMRESPHDPLPHLVFADWLEDYNHPTIANLIRRHVEHNGKLLANGFPPHAAPVFDERWYMPGHNNKWSYYVHNHADNPVVEIGAGHDSVRHDNDIPDFVPYWQAILTHSELPQIERGLLNEGAEPQGAVARNRAIDLHGYPESNRNDS